MMVDSLLENQTRQPEGSTLGLGRTRVFHAGCAVMNAVGVEPIESLGRILWLNLRTTWRSRAI
jgi:hypothetical protein